MSLKENELERLQTLAREAARGCGVELVDVRFQRQGRHSSLRLDIDRPGAVGVSLGDCEAVSRLLDRALQDAGMLQDLRYDLQVSSPGLDRPIRSDDDFRRNTGRALVVEVFTPAGPVTTVRGILVGASEGEIVLRVAEGEDLRLARDRVHSAVQDPYPNDAARTPRPGRKSRGPRGIV